MIDDLHAWYDHAPNYYKPIAYAICATLIYRILLFVYKTIRRTITKRVLAKYYALNNLKAGYTYLDHTADDYSLTNSELHLIGNLNLKCDTDSINSVISNASIIPLNISKNKDSILSVHSFSHNRDQDILEDEKHWFRINFYSTDIETKNILQALWASMKTKPEITQPKAMNQIFPFVSGLKISVILYFDRYKPYIICKDDDFLIDHIVSLSEIDIPNQNAVCLNVITCNLISKSGYRISERSIHFTDIGIDNDPLYLRLFAYVKVEPPQGYKKDPLCHKAKNIFNMMQNPSLNEAFKSYLLRMHIMLT